MECFVGTYTRMGGPGIARCALEGQTLRLLQTDDTLDNPTYIILSRNGQRLYAVSSGPCGGEPGGSAASYDLSETGMVLGTRQSTGGDAPCHLTLSPDERFLYVANYLSGSLSVFPLTDAGIAPRVQLIQHSGHGPHPTRQTGPHLHHVTFTPGDPTLLHAIDLGIDAVVTYRQNPATGLLCEAARTPCEPGFGPRHLDYAADGQMAYLTHELGNAVTVLAREGEGWRCIQTLPTLPEGFTGVNTTAAIRVTEGEVMVSNRGHDSIAFYTRLPDGRLTPGPILATPGKIPRDFMPLPGGRMLIAQQDAGGLALVKRGPDGLTPLCEPLPIAGAVCVLPTGRD